MKTKSVFFLSCSGRYALRKELNRKQGEINRKTGHFTEIIAAGVMRNFDSQTVDGDLYFNTSNQVMLPRMEQIMVREGVVKDGTMIEIDVIGEYQLFNHQEGNAGLGVCNFAKRTR